MNRIEEMPHLRSVFRQLGGDITAIMDLVNRIRDVALQQDAADLIRLCDNVIEDGALSDHYRDWILDAYAMLDSTDADTGKKFTNGRKLGTVGPIRKKIAALLKKNPTIKNPEIWTKIEKALPRGWTAFDNRQGKYLEGPTAADNMGQRRFFNICAEERKQIKP